MHFFKNIRNTIIVIFLKIQSFFVRDKDLHEIVNFLKYNKLTYFNYDWFHKFDCKLQYPIMHDENDRFYIQYQNHKMYFKKDWSEQRIREYLNNLLPEQDPRSPHLYFASGEKKEKYSVVVDGGAAEGLFAISVLSVSDKLYLIEPDPEWVEALKMTFSHEMDKVVIIDKFIGNNSQYNLSNIVAAEGHVDLIKLDIEGAELNALYELGDNIKLVNEIIACVYHYQTEEADLKRYLDHLQNVKIDYKVRPGYIFFMHDTKQTIPFLRRGVIKICIKEH